ncbi:YbaB/EbfC family nucleoid-associated protein [Mycolicibacterium sp.]|uniref:YbaB/EbfC family nucleoid-associated protein n=1 Tax=Mycolicibacterium sp. TaxID=2320850 RepID=UPI003D0AA402
MSQPTVSSGAADAVLAGVARQHDLLRAMDEHCRQLSARVTSRDRSVSVEVDGFGALTGLWLADSAYRHGAAALSALIVETAVAAAQLVADRQRTRLAEFTERFAALRYLPTDEGTPGG